MKIRIVAIGKLKDSGLRAVVDDYMKRLEHYFHVEEVELRSERALTQLFKETEHWVALEVEGHALTSVELSRWLQGWQDRGRREVTFLIGGAEGIPKTISARASQRLSLSRLTLPHRIARLVLVEQLYRAGTLLRGEPYAREN